jgi:hypothetical protein
VAKKKVIGRCRICGSVGELSFEHVPPQAAFNKRPVIRANLEKALSLGPDELLTGTVQQRGMGDHTLCIPCNNMTGSWYGGSFVNWCYQGMEILQRSQGNPSLFYLNYLFPLRILKQIVTMFFSVNADGFQDKNPELVRFVLNKEAKYLSPNYRFFVYYNIEGRHRSVGIVAGLKLDGRGAAPAVFSEITYPPFGYVMALGGPPPDDRLYEISRFARYDYNEFRVEEVRLPVLATHTSVPGDYRTKDEVLREAGRSAEIKKGPVE